MQIMMLSANKNGTGLAGLLCMALVVMLFASMFTNAESTQMFYPNGRYGRRSDPDLKPIVGVDNDLDMTKLEVNGLTRLGTPLSCTYLGIGDLFQCTLSTRSRSADAKA